MRRKLGIGLAAAVIVYAIPFTRLVFSALVTLFHEFGHAVMGWLLGCPSLPAFDFVYGGGFTHMGDFHVSLAIAIALGMGYAIWHFREDRRIVIALGIVFLVWLVFVTKEWRRELAFASAGHLAEFILAGIFFYKTLKEEYGASGAFVAFFVQIHSMLFAWKLISDASFLDWYREGKGGALMNDLEVVALDLNIYLGINPEIIGVARMLLFFSLLPMVIALVWWLKQSPGGSHALPSRGVVRPASRVVGGIRGAANVRHEPGARAASPGASRAAGPLANRVERRPAPGDGA